MTYEIPGEEVGSGKKQRNVPVWSITGQYSLGLPAFLSRASSTCCAGRRRDGCAIQGAKTLVVTQHNAWIHPVATVAVVVAGFVFRVSRNDWALLVFAITFVWLSEAMNTALEFLADEVSEEKRERIGEAKDIAAFGVLVSAAAANVIGGIVFLPHFLQAR